MDYSCRVLYQALTSEKAVYVIKKIKVANQNYISKYGLMRRAANNTLLAIYGIMYTKYCDKTLRTETIECINNGSLD